MIDAKFENVQALIVDDFDNFRVMLFNMLKELGVPRVDVASSDKEALRLCEVSAYNLILCDQNLGAGKTGQQILEFLRHTPNFNNDSIFVLISGESNKNIIMAAFDHEPDDYLTKPITSRALAQRLGRLLTQRLALAPIYAALKDSNLELAINLCKREIQENKRYNNHCKKLLGDLLLDARRSSDAEQLYRDILDVHQLDWAQLGMARVKQMQGDSLSAQHWLEEAIQYNPYCLKAYDVLAEVLSELGDFPAQQNVLIQALKLSPFSLLRQQALATIALRNNDLLNAVAAFRSAAKLGENSCHDRPDIHVGFARATIQLAKIDRNMPRPVLRDALKSVGEFSARFGNTADNKVNALLLEAQLHSSVGDDRKSREAMLSAQKIIDVDYDQLTLPTKIERVNASRAINEIAKADELTRELLGEYSHNEDALRQIDSLLEEPCSEMNKALVAKINKDGIAFYDAKEFVRAIQAFNGALQGFPKHVGLRLNLVQALVAQLTLKPLDQQLFLLAQQTLVSVAPLISSNHAQYLRFRQLEDSFKRLESGKSLPH